MILLHYTPVERHLIEGKEVFVKREDMATPPPGPCFSKTRGLYAHMLKLRESGVKEVGYLETAISMAGWGVAWVGKILGIQVTIFDPAYSSKHVARKVHQFHRKQWLKLGAVVVQVTPLMTRINFNVIQKHLFPKDPSREFLPLGLPLEETIEETARQAEITSSLPRMNTVVVSVGSGTVCAGILRGIGNHPIHIVGVMCRDGNKNRKMKEILKRSKVLLGDLWGPDFTLINPGYAYTDKETTLSPGFPCNPYYDLKALKYLVDHYDELEPPILFWNIGGGGYNITEG